VYGNQSNRHLITKHTAMTNKEILNADLLDIIFEKRNKDYGAYAIRRGYNHRLLTAMGAALSVILLFVLINSMDKKDISTVPLTRNENIVEITEVKILNEKPKEPDKPKEIVKPVQKTATIAFISKIVITPDNKVKNKVPDLAKTEGKKISDTTQTGTADKGIPQLNVKPVDTINKTGNGNGLSKTQPEFTAKEKDPEFPGGPDALKRFLAQNLSAPSDLEEGEKKTVHIRFKVDKDGSVNTFEIITSGGNEFDNEVVRVCKKMPRWIPAIQNGIHVPVSYVLPVIFIGVEQ